LETLRNQPITRPVYMEVREVPRHHADPIAIVRTSEWTSIWVHPGTPTPEGIEGIAHQLEDDEHFSWGTPWVGSAVDLRALARAPIATLARVAPTILTTLVLPHVVPRIQRAPWGIYL
jgi:hypothetical protein